MLKTMLCSASPNLTVGPLLAMGCRLATASMMSSMSSDQEVDALTAYRFHRRPVVIGGRQEHTFYVGGTSPLEHGRNRVGAGPSIEGGIATGFASRAHYVWVGGALQHFFERGGDQIGDSRLVTAVYGYRPAPLRTEAGKPDLRFFVEMTAEDRGASQVGGRSAESGSRTVLLGPTSLLLYKAVAVEAGVLFPAYQRIDAATARERVRVAVNFAYFFWLK